MGGISREAREVHDAALIVDLHCDLLLTRYFTGWDWTRRHRANPLPAAPLMGHTDLPRLREGNVGCLAMGIVTNPLRGRSGPAAVSGDLDRLAAMVAEAGGEVEIATTAQAVRTARERGKIACFAGLEGAHGLDGRLDALAGYKARGLGYVGLAHFSANAACRPMVGWGQSRTEGLSDYGRDLCDALHDLRIVVDVAHVNKPGVLEVTARAPGPVVCSHTACDAVYPSPRSLDDDQLRAIADTGGVIGVIFARPFLGPGGVGAVVAHLDHIRRTVGVDHAALGTDWEGWTLYPDGLESAEKLPALTDALLRAGLSPDEILAIYGENFLRVLAEVSGS